MSKKKSSIITPPPEVAVGEGNQVAVLDLSDEQRKEALIKLVRKGAPSMPPKEKEERAGERARFSVRMTPALLERINRAAHERPVPTPVNTWITEAILAQLKKEGC